MDRDIHADQLAQRMMEKSYFWIAEELALLYRSKDAPDHGDLKP